MAIFIVVVTLLGGILLGDASAQAGFFGRFASLMVGGSAAAGQTLQPFF